MKDRTRFALAAVLYLGCTFGVARLARAPSEVAPFLGAVLAGSCLFLTAALLPSRTFSRRTLLGLGTIFSACTVLPLVFVADRALWLRENPALLGYYWLWMFLLAIPSPRARRWCLSPALLLVVTAVLGGGVAAITAWTLG
jgi:ABC-type multidrug transport system permease subunit